MTMNNNLAAVLGGIAEQLVKRRHAILILFLMVLGLGIWGLQRVTTDAGWDNWVLEDTALNLADEQFKEVFGNNDYVGVLVSADNIFEHGTLSLIRELGRELKDNVPFAEEIVSVTDCEFSTGDTGGIHIINPVPSPVPSDSAVLADIRNLFLSKGILTGRLVSKKADEAWIILRLLPFPEGWRNENKQAADLVVGKAATDIIRQEKYAPLRPMASGMPIIAHDKTEFFKAELQRTLELSLLISLFIVTFALRSLQGVCITLLVTASSVVLSFGLQGWLGNPIDVGMVMVPLYLGIAIAICYSIHVITFFRRKFTSTGKRHEAVRHAFCETCWPVLFTALTTICAFCSFLFVGVKPVRWIGFTSSLQVGIIFFMTVIMVPVLLSFGRNRAVAGSGLHSGSRRFDLALEKTMTRLAGFVLDHPKGILAAFMLLVAVFTSGLFFFRINFDIRETMGLKVPYVNRLHDISRSQLGALYSYDLVVEFPSGDMALQPENLRKFEQLQKTAEGFALTARASSIIEIIKDMHQVLSRGEPQFHSIPDTQDMVAQILLLYTSSGGSEVEKWIDYEYRRLRLMVDLKDYNTEEANRELEELTRKAEELFPDSEVILAGSIAQLTVMQDVVGKGQLLSIVLALAMISILMMWVFSSLKVGLIAMIPNIAPALAAGGIMGWAGVPLDMITITVMPMILGLAVDDTIHFVFHAKAAFGKTGSYRESMRRTFAGVGIPMLFTSLILTASFSVYTMSPARVYVYTGLVVAIGIMAALLADYFITPVLLRGLNAFGPEKKEKGT